MNSIDVETLRGRRSDRRWDRVSVGDLLERVTWSTPDKVALIGWDNAHSEERFARVTYRQGDQSANRVANGLLAAGLTPGDRVLLYCDNSVEAMLFMIGIAKAGMVAVPVNPLLAPDVLEYALRKVEPAFAVVDAELHGRGLEAFRAYGIAPQVVIQIGEGDAEGASPFGEWIDAQSDVEPDVEIHGDDVWALVFTSGTTSMPKATMMTHNYSYFAGYGYALTLTRGVEIETDLVAVTFMPIIYHCGHNSIPVPGFQCGGTVVLGRRPDAAKTAAAVTAERATAAWLGSPIWVEKLVQEAEKHPDEVDLTSLKVAMFSWGSMQPDLSDRLTKVCGPQARMVEVFGQTESMSSTRFWPNREPEKHAEAIRGANHVGRPTPIIASAIQRADGTLLQGIPGEAGEVVYRGPAITAGYYRDQAETEAAFRDGWFHSGDSCKYTEDGSQIMVDRFKDIVKSGGENVSSIRVEGVLASHPSVETVAVVGLPDEQWGEAVTAVVILREGHEVAESELLGYARQRLAGFESPKKVILVDEMPATVGGKIMKFKLRQALAGQ